MPNRPDRFDAEGGVRAWGVVAGSAVGIALGPGALVFYSLGIFLAPIAQATGWTVPQITLAVTIFTAVLIASISIAGVLIDRYGVRPVVLVSIVLFALSLMCLRTANTLMAFYSCFAALAVLGAGANSIGYMRAVCGWFLRRRGLAVGIAASGMGVSVMLMPLITQWMLSRWNWQGAYFGLGLIVLGVSLPIVALLVREAPVGAVGVPTHAIGDGGISARVALRSRRYWMVFAAFVLLSAAINSTAVHLVSLIGESNSPRSIAVLGASFFGAAMALSRPVTGFLLDRFFAPSVAAVIFSGSTVGLLMLALGAEQQLALVASLLVGASAGADGDLLSYLISRYFGQRSFATLNGYVFAGYLLAASIGPYAIGVERAHTGSYAIPMLACAALNVICVLLMLGLGPFPDAASMHRVGADTASARASDA